MHEDVVFDYFVERISSLPIPQFAQLRDVSVLDGIARLSELSATAESLEQEISDDLYEIVPDLSSATRATVISFRRDIFNRRERWRSDQRVFEILRSVRSELLRKISVLDTTLVEHATLSEKLGRQLHARELEESELLIGLSTTPLIASAIALTSPSAWRAIEGSLPTNRPAVRRKLARTLLMYAQRGALKPGPLSTFTELNVCGPMAPDRTAHPTALLAISAVRCILHALSAADEFKEYFSFASNPTLLQMDDERARLTVPMYQRIENQFNWRRDDVAIAEVPGWLTRRLNSLPPGSTGNEVEEHVGHETSLRFLVDTGLVLPLLPWETVAGAPQADLRRLIPEDHHLNGVLADVERVTREIPSASAAQRSKAVAAVNSKLSGVYQYLGRTPPVFVTGHDVVRENFLGSKNAKMKRSLMRSVETAQEVYREGLHRGVLHDALIAHAREIMGTPKGTVVIDDLEYLLSHLSYGASTVQRYQSTMHEEMALLTRFSTRQDLSDSRPVIETPSTPPAIGMAIIQEHPAGGPDVLDSIGPYGPGQFTRYTETSLRQVTNEELRSWVEDQVDASAYVLEVTTATDQNDLQKDAASVWPALRWPLDTHRRDGGEVPLADLVLTIDQDDAVTLRDRTDQPVSLVYVGVVPIELISGPIRNLISLASPWAFSPIDAGPYEIPPQKISEPIIRERETRKNLVLSRHTIECEISDLPRAFLDGVTPGAVQKLFSRFSDWGLGEEIYVKTVPKTLSFAASPKPSWVSLGSVASLQSLRHTLRRESGTHHLQITEALPTVCDYTEAGVDAVTQTMHLVGG